MRIRVHHVHHHTPPSHPRKDAIDTHGTSASPGGALAAVPAISPVLSVGGALGTAAPLTLAAGLATALALPSVAASSFTSEVSCVTCSCSASTTLMSSSAEGCCAASRTPAVG